MILFTPNFLFSVHASLKRKNIFFHLYALRSGTIHVGASQTFDVDASYLDLPVSVRVYQNGWVGLGEAAYIRQTDVALAGTLGRTQNLTILDSGKLWLNLTGKTDGQSARSFSLGHVHLQNGGLVFLGCPRQR